MSQTYLSILSGTCLGESWFHMAGLAASGCLPRRGADRPEPVFGLVEVDAHLSYPAVKGADAGDADFPFVPVLRVHQYESFCPGATLAAKISSAP